MFQKSSINPGTNTVTHAEHSLTLVDLASPHNTPNTNCEIDGLVNHTVSIQPRAQVEIVLANTDRCYMDSFELTTSSPSYLFVAMAAVTDSFFLMLLR